MIYGHGASKTDQCAHWVMDHPADSMWRGSTLADDYLAFYHEERLYTVRHLKKGIVCLVHARSPYDAIEKVRGMEALE